MLDVLLANAAVVVSLALQHGITPEALDKSLAGAPAAPLSSTDLATPRQTAPASVIGAAPLCAVEAVDTE